LPLFPGSNCTETPIRTVIWRSSLTILITVDHNQRNKIYRWFCTFPSLLVLKHQLSNKVRQLHLFCFIKILMLLVTKKILVFLVNQYQANSIECAARRYGARLLRGRARVRAPLTPTIFHLPTYFSCTSPDLSLPCCTCFAYQLDKNKDGSPEQKQQVTSMRLIPIRFFYVVKSSIHSKYCPVSTLTLFGPHLHLYPCKDNP
jgi:hypothetical protein